MSQACSVSINIGRHLDAERESEQFDEVRFELLRKSEDDIRRTLRGGIADVAVTLLDENTTTGFVDKLDDLTRLVAKSDDDEILGRAFRALIDDTITRAAEQTLSDAAVRAEVDRVQAEKRQNDADDRAEAMAFDREYV